MMTAAYVIGGSDLLEFRFKQLSSRNPNLDVKRMKDLALSFGANERRWMKEKAKLTYSEIVPKFKSPLNTNRRIYSLKSLFPLVKGFKTEDIYGYNLRDSKQVSNLSSPPLVKGSDWRSRIVNARSLKNLTNLEATQ